MSKPTYSGAYSRRRYSNAAATFGDNAGFRINVTSASPQMGTVQLLKLYERDKNETLTGQESGYRGTGGHASYRVTAVPNAGFEFAGWTGDVPAGKGTANPLTVVVSKDVALTAHFRIAPDPVRTITVSVNDPSMGRVLASGLANGEIAAHAGDTVKLTAQPNSSSRFVAWQGGPIDGMTSEEVSFVVGSNLHVRAVFEPASGGSDDPAGEFPTWEPAHGQGIAEKALAFAKQWWWAILIVGYIAYKELKGGRQ